MAQICFGIVGNLSVNRFIRRKEINQLEYFAIKLFNLHPGCTIFCFGDNWYGYTPAINEKLIIVDTNTLKSEPKQALIDYALQNNINGISLLAFSCLSNYMTVTNFIDYTNYTVDAEYFDCVKSLIDKKNAELATAKNSIIKKQNELETYIATNAEAIRGFEQKLNNRDTELAKATTQIKQLKDELKSRNLLLERKTAQLTNTTLELNKLKSMPGNNVVVAMTSWKNRIDKIVPVLESWFKQTVRPTKIFLTLASDEFKLKENELPKQLLSFLTAHPTVVLNWVKENTKPFKKILPILKYCNDTDWIMAVDDDIIFKEDYLEIMCNEFAKDTSKPLKPNKYWFTILNGEQGNFGPGCFITKQMFNNWDKLLTPEIITNGADDIFYSCLLWFNGYKLREFNLDISKYRYTQEFGKVGITSQGNGTVILKDMISSCEALFKQSVINRFGCKPKFNFLDTIDILCYDRLWKAEDNGEYLCRYIVKTFPEIRCRYIVSFKNKQAVTRLRKLGIQLVDSDDKKALKIAVGNCSHLCGSVFSNALNIDIPKTVNDIFLNHGCFIVPSKYLAQHSNKTLYFAANSVEYANMKNSYHNIDPTKIKLTGQPRHDYLVNGQRQSHTENKILIQFWFRRYLEKDETKFLKSDFYKNVSALLTDHRLLSISKKYNVEFVFKLHSEAVCFSKYFDKLPNVIISDKNDSFEDLFINSKLLITDISSNAYEMAKIGKPCIYYEPDFEELISYRTTLNDGYELDLKKNGIGPVTTTIEALIKELEHILNNNCKIDQPYLDRRLDQLSFINDNHNCERCFKAIMECKSLKTLGSTDVIKQNNSIQQTYLYF